ncbi:ParB/RepB/Spo0J family partition protein [Massilia cellulosiltytica]|uniref:ParB/RepB/Spo0J family partition protein n=1 Tax=Massilia cellulosiltytica TaxID=2683234 RepID=UPI0039B54E84
MNTRLNLTGLADLAHEGKPKEMPLGDIIPDPANPRNTDDENEPAAIEAQKELDADVAERGVKTPISVRPHPNILGKYIINYGRRRYRAACNNAFATIPAFVDEKFDSYDQFNENELRTGLSTRARALFIKSRLDAGDTRGEIAQRMRKKNQNFITEHMALLDAPACVNKAYADGVKSARTLYDLRQAWEEFPVEIEAWCQHITQITREGIKDAVESFRHGRFVSSNGDVSAGSESSGSGFRHDEMLHPVEADASAVASQFRHDEKLPLVEADEPAATPQFRHDEKILRSDRRSGMAAAALQARPSDGIIVQYKGKPATVVPGTTVSIVVDGTDVPLNVPLSELVFKR